MSGTRPDGVASGAATDHYERRLRARGFRLVGGVDEVGRGALAGPMVAAAVILSPSFPVEGIRDSKALTASQRETWYERIVAGAVAVSVRRALPGRIDRRGLHRTNLALLRQAVAGLPVCPDFVLIDGFVVPGLRLPRLSVKKGDATCASIAAASIVAKVTRDRTMDRYHRRFPAYAFDRNRGYGTAEHLAAIERLGPTPIHRLSFRRLSAAAGPSEEG